MNTEGKIAFAVIIGLAVFMVFWVKGVVFSGMFMGIMSTIAVWVLVIKSPLVIQNWMGKHVLISDLFLTSIGASLIASIGPGPTVFMATVTQMVLLSVLLQTLKPA